MPDVYMTRRLFPESDSYLRRHVRITTDLSRAEGAITQLTDRIDEQFFRAAPQLRVVSQCAVGVDNIDLRAAARRGIAVMNTPGVLTQATADLTWALILAVARRVPEGDRLCRKNRFPGWDLEFMLGRELRGATLGIVGPGRIGRAVAQRARGFGMKVICAGGHGKLPRGLRRVPLASLLSRADIVSLHVPATRATRRLIGAAQLSLMKRGAILINTSRGTALDETALARALRSGKLWGAGLDVFAQEPRIPAALRRLPNTVLLPHLGSATRETRGAMAMTAARNLVAFFEGRPRPGNLVLHGEVGEARTSGRA